MLGPAAIGIVITSLIISAAIYFPVVGFFCSFFIPAPIVFYRLVLGRKEAGVIMGASALIVALISPGPSDIFIAALLLVLGFFLGDFIEKRLPIEKVFIFSCGASLLVGFLCLFVYAGYLDIGTVELVSEYVSKSLELTLAAYKDSGAGNEYVQLFSDAFEHINYVVLSIVPAIAVMSALFISWADILIVRPILKKHGLEFRQLQNLNTWRSPDFIVWAAIGSGLVLMLPDKSVKIIGLNILLILMPIYFFQGMGIISFLLEKKNVPKLAKVFAYTIIGFQQILVAVVAGLGFFDTWFNFRKKR